MTDNHDDFVRDDDDQNIGVNPSTTTTLTAIIDTRLSRREALKGLGAAGAFGLFGGAGLAHAAPASAARSSLTFQEIKHALETAHTVAPGYDAQILIRWGDKVKADAPAFDVRNQSAAAQLKQFGYDNDFLAFMPLPYGSNSSTRGLLCSNHERTSPGLMWPGLGESATDKMNQAQAEVEMASQGHAVIEVRRREGKWEVVVDSPYNRRFTPFEARMRVSGPAAGHARMKTTADPAGGWVIGTMNNCAGGKTPWGTVLTGEENIHSYFLGDAEKSREARGYKRYGISGKPRYAWGKWHDRFNLDKEPNEPNRFGWVVEIDPYDTTAPAVKRTALGRFKHEGATTAISHDGRVAVYSGDDERFEYVYKFVTRDKYAPRSRQANRDLLDNGTLYAARFDGDGTMTWLPLVHGEGPLTAANGFDSQADVVIEARRAADLVGATPMDRPEDIEPNPRSGRIYVVLTFNERRKPAQRRQRARARQPR